MKIQTIPLCASHVFTQPHISLERVSCHTSAGRKQWPLMIGVRCRRQPTAAGQVSTQNPTNTAKGPAWLVNLLSHSAHSRVQNPNKNTAKVSAWLANSRVTWPTKQQVYSSMPCSGTYSMQPLTPTNIARYRTAASITAAAWPTAKQICHCCAQQHQAAGTSFAWQHNKTFQSCNSTSSVWRT
jgi:hypothetical protein